MELDEFKVFYQAQFEQVADKSGSDLETMLRKRSRSAIERILRNMLWEVIFALVIVLVLSFLMAVWSSTIFRWAGLGLVVISVVQVVAFTWQYRRLTARLNQATGSVRNYIQEVAAIVDRFVSAYYRYCMSAIPLGAIIGAILGIYMGTTNDRSDPAFSVLPEHPGLPFLVISLVLALGTVLATYFMLRWYIHRLYGRYLDELKNCLSELNSQAN
ncbi:hypothetical protein [Spirosoma pollinicola]|uniref:Uncharacterized protein n=1 Tax=Spirosoma pollinicola TaxID=2057025 RepID=A0A2K8YS29_9BACT|nr:hypothetical protein [Spirosoma pollinicola]AUD00384.1 hypothetical protein CWM47_00245 [Spirosoma pollinicola]